MPKKQETRSEIAQSNIDGIIAGLTELHEKDPERLRTFLRDQPPHAPVTFEDAKRQIEDKSDWSEEFTEWCGTPEADQFHVNLKNVLAFIH